VLREQIREHLLAMIASHSGVDGMDLATEIAKEDISPRVQAGVVQSLQFRNADRHVASLLAKALDLTWLLVLEGGYAGEIRSPWAAKRLHMLRNKLLAKATGPGARLRLLLDQPANYPGRDAGIAAAIADSRFPVRDQRGDASVFYAQKRAPAAILRGLRLRLEKGLELPFGVDDFLGQLDFTDEGPIAAAILDVDGKNRDVNGVAAMAGPKTVGALIDNYLACKQALKAARNDRALGEKYLRLGSRIAATRAPSFVSAVMARADTDDPVLVASLASLVSLHGDSDDRKVPIPVTPLVKPEVIGILRSWVEAVISSPNGERYQLNEVSNAIGRFGFRELVPELKRLLDEDIARLRKARGGFMEARRRGDIRATSDASMRYGNQYREAFSRIGGDEAAAVAAAYLEDRVFGVHASLILKSISDKQLNLPEPNLHRGWPSLDEVAAAQAQRAISPKREPANAHAVPIFAAINRLAKPETDKEGQLLAIQLARVALAMSHSVQDALIKRVMNLPQPLKSKRELLAAIALDGQVLDVDVIMQGVDEWLAEAPKDAWHKKQNTWEIEPWLELLPFTTRPESVIDGLTKVKAFYARDWAQRWERVLSAVACVPGAEGEALLEAVARTHKDIAGDFEWMKAVLGRDSVSAALLYVDLYMEGVFGRGPHPVDGWHAGREVAAYAQKFPQLKAELKKRYEAVGTGPARAMLEHLFGEIGFDDELIAMVKKYAANGQAYDDRMAAAVRAVALRHEPMQDGSNYVNIHPASVAQVRKLLFGLVGSGQQEAALARSCLTAIDVLRDEFGIAANDARHPDVMSETPWPPEAG
jgi:hypothetical protein